MDRFPSHRHLKHAVKFVQRHGVRHKNAPPDHGADPKQPDLQLQKNLSRLRRCPGIRHATRLQEALHNASSRMTPEILVVPFIDERSSLWHSLVFSAAERESTNVIDGLMHNDVVRSDIHSTDEHGFMEAVFCVTHLLGISYAPRCKDLKKHKLYRFRSGSDQEAEWPIVPTKHVDENAVRVSWDDLLRLLATIRLKEATASEIFRRLNSYSRQHRLYAAMKAFGQIIKSMFILRFIDQVELRQAIEKQLNKVEFANGFTRAVAVGKPRGFEHSDKEDQEITEGCNRLIKNSIICWNYLYLSRFVETDKTPEEQDRILKMVALHSPLTWGYINLLGEYDLTRDRLQDNTGVLPPNTAQDNPGKLGAASSMMRQPLLGETEFPMADSVPMLDSGRQ